MRITGICVASRTARVSGQSKTRLDAVGVHGGEQNFAGSELLATPGPFDRVDAFVVAASAGIDVPGVGAAATGVDGQDNGLRAEFGAQLEMRLGRRTAAVLTLTLSAPA